MIPTWDGFVVQSGQEGLSFLGGDTKAERGLDFLDKFLRRKGFWASESAIGPGFESKERFTGVEDVGKGLSAEFVFCADAVEARIGVTVVGRDDYERVGRFCSKFQGDTDGLVKFDLFAQEGGDVVVMGGMVNACAFNLKEETLGGFTEDAQSDLGHLGESWDAVAEEGVRLDVDSVRQMRACKKPKEFFCGWGNREELLAILDKEVLILLEEGNKVFFIGAGIGEEKVASAAEEDVN